MKYWLMTALLAMTTIAGAQVDEQANQAQKNLAAVARALQGSLSMTGSLNGGPTYARIFTNDVQNDCTATSRLSGSGTGVQYAVIEINSPTGATLVASLANPGTDLGDSTLSLYCDPFDDTDATLNLVGYNDDAVGLLSTFDGSEGIVLAPGDSYFLVVSLFSPALIGGGNFELSIAGLNVGEVVQFGPAGSPPVPQIVPTMGIVGALLMILLFATVGFRVMRRQQV